MSGYQIVCEALLINQGDVHHNLDNWESGKSKVLFILGFSGSGKSTDAKKLVSKYNADLFELDNSQELYDLYQKSSTKYKNNPKLWEKASKKWMVDKLRKTTKPTIWEGVDLYLTFTPEELSKFSMIIKGTSYLTSTIRGYKRDKGSNRTFFWRLGINKDLIKYHNRLVKYLKRLK